MVQEVDPLGNTGGTNQWGGRSSVSSLVLLPLLLAHLLHFLPYPVLPSPPPPFHSQPAMCYHSNTDLSVVCWAIPLNPNPQGSGVSWKVKNFWEVPWEEKVQLGNSHKPRMLATSGHCSLQNSKALSNTQWGAFQPVQISGQISHAPKSSILGKSKQIQKPGGREQNSVPGASNLLTGGSDNRWKPHWIRSSVLSLPLLWQWPGGTYSERNASPH